MTKELNTDNPITFEEAFRKLEEIARQLEDSTTPLEKSFELFEEGQALLKRCHEMLDSAEKKLKILQVGGDSYSIREERIG